MHGDGYTMQPTESASNRRKNDGTDCTNTEVSLLLPYITRRQILREPPVRAAKHIIYHV